MATGLCKVFLEQGVELFCWGLPCTCTWCFPPKKIAVLIFYWSGRLCVSFRERFKILLLNLEHLILGQWSLKKGCMAGLSLRTETVSFCGKIPYTFATGSSSLCLKVGYIYSLSFIGYFAACSCFVILKLCT